MFHLASLLRLLVALRQALQDPVPGVDADVRAAAPLSLLLIVPLRRRPVRERKFPAPSVLDAVAIRRLVQVVIALEALRCAAWGQPDHRRRSTLVAGVLGERLLVALGLGDRRLVLDPATLPLGHIRQA